MQLKRACNHATTHCPIIRTSLVSFAESCFICRASYNLTDKGDVKPRPLSSRTPLTQMGRDTSMSLCKPCQEAFNQAAPFKEPKSHHTTINELLDAAQIGCYTCARLINDLSDEQLECLRRLAPLAASTNVPVTKVLEAPLNQRGWVLQERLLAPRILHFCRRELFWECCETAASETYPSGLPPWVLHSSLKKLDPMSELCIEERTAGNVA